MAEIVDETQDETDSSTEPWSSITRTSTRFKIPLENAGIDVDAILSEFKEMVEYAIQFLSLSTMDYQTVWWRLFNCPCSGEWSRFNSFAILIPSIPYQYKSEN